LTKISIFDKNWLCFDQNPVFRPKSRFLAKIWIFDQNHVFFDENLGPTVGDFGKKLGFSSKMLVMV